MESQTECAPSTQPFDGWGHADAAPALRALLQYQPFPQFPPQQSCAINQPLHLTTGRHKVAAKMEIAKLSSDCLNRERVVTMLWFGYTTVATRARQQPPGSTSLPSLVESRSWH